MSVEKVPDNTGNISGGSSSIASQTQVNQQQVSPASSQIHGKTPVKTDLAQKVRIFFSSISLRRSTPKKLSSQMKVEKSNPDTEKPATKKTSLVAKLISLFEKKPSTEESEALKTIEDIISKPDTALSEEQMKKIAAVLKKNPKNKFVVNKLASLAGEDTRTTLVSILTNIPKQFEYRPFAEAILEKLDSSGTLETHGIALTKDLVSEQVPKEQVKSILRSETPAIAFLAKVHEIVMNKHSKKQISSILESIPNKYYDLDMAKNSFKDSTVPHQESIRSIETQVLDKFKKAEELSENFPQCLKDLNKHIYEEVYNRAHTDATKRGGENPAAEATKVANDYVLQPFFLRFLSPKISTHQISAKKVVDKEGYSQISAAVSIGMGIQGIVNETDPTITKGKLEHFFTKTLQAEKNPYPDILKSIKRNIMPSGFFEKEN